MVSGLGLALALVLPGSASAGSTLYAYAVGAVLFGAWMTIILLVISLVGRIRRHRGDRDARYRQKPSETSWRLSARWRLLILAAAFAAFYWAHGARGIAFVAGWGLGIAVAFRLVGPLMLRALALDDQRSH